MQSVSAVWVPALINTEFTLLCTATRLRTEHPACPRCYVAITSLYFHSLRCKPGQDDIKCLSQTAVYLGGVLRWIIHGPKPMVISTECLYNPGD